jgi:hypothetical protein
MTYEEIELLRHSQAVTDKKNEMKQTRLETNMKLEESFKNDYYTRLYSEDTKYNDYEDFSKSVNEAFVTEALTCLVNSCLSEVTLKDEYNSRLSRQLVSNFVKEEGAHKLLTKFKGTSYLMSELAYICNKHTKAVLEKADPNDKDSLKINKKQKDDFYKDLDKASADKVVDSIRSRVMGSTQEFIDSNTKDKMKIKDILTNTKEKIENSKDKKIQEGYSNLGKEKVSDIRSKKIQNVFEAMVYSMAKTSLKNEDAKKVFVENSALNMDKLIEHCEVMYTFLTTLDTCKIIDVNESYIEEMLKDLKK